MDETVLKRKGGRLGVGLKPGSTTEALLDFITLNLNMKPKSDLLH